MTFPDDSPTPPHLHEPPAAGPEQPATPPPPSGGATQPSPLRPLIAAAVLVVVLAAFGGAALSHLLWPNSASPSSSASLFGGGLQQLPRGGGSSQTNPFGSGSANGGNPSSGSSTPPASAPAGAASVAAKITPGLVDVNTTTAQGPAAGTGMVVTANGEVLTNNHVISGAQSISVTDIGNGRTYNAHVVGYDRKHDVAVLMLVNASGLATVPLGDSSVVKVGDNVITFGNAGGVGGRPAEAGGSVDALHQSIKAGDPGVPGDQEQLADLIQINGDIQPGDSGGPLTVGGKVVGMDTAASVGFSFQSTTGAGFAIPINQALTIARNIVAGHSTATIHIGGTAIIGVYVANNTANSDAYVGCPTQDANTSGVLIAPESNGSGIIPGSPAASAGVQTCDVITSLNGTRVGSPAKLLSAMETHHPGDHVTLGWVDTAGRSHSATITLTAGNPG